MARSARVIGRWIKRQMPKTLFGRSLLIIVLPVAIMQIAVTYVFFDAHWQTVTSRLSEGLAGDIAWAVESYRDDPSPAAFAKLSKRAEDSMSLSIALQPGRKLPAAQRDEPVLAQPFLAPIDQSLRRQRLLPPAVPAPPGSEPRSSGRCGSCGPSQSSGK